MSASIICAAQKEGQREHFDENCALWTRSWRKKKENMHYVRWRMQRASIYIPLNAVGSDVKQS